MTTSSVSQGCSNKRYTPGDVRQQKRSRSVWRPEAGTRGIAGLAPPGNPRGEPLPPLPLLVVARGPRRSSAYRCSSSVSASGQQGLLGGLPFSPPLRTLVVGFRAHPNLGGLIFRSFAYLITSAKTLFLKKVTFAVPHAHTLRGTPFAVTPGQHRCCQCLLHVPHSCPTNLTHCLPVLVGGALRGGALT